MPNANQLRTQVAFVLNWIGLILCVVVVLKQLLGVHVNFIPGSVEALALVAIACSVAR